MHVVGEGVDEPFDSTEGGLIALELYAGKYRATLSADGFLDKSIAFEVPAKGEIQLKETLVRDKPPETPNVSASGRSIRLRKSIRYRGNDLDPASHAILDELATFLSFHKEYESIEIGVHTDDRGAAKARSDARADAVRSYLVGKGISPDRVVAKGYGASSPVAVNLTAAGRAKNNRTAITVRKSSGSD
jgi:outer membrane protein OmpA-like peptidoglycan-associated protein